ncbi:FG-GAP repeat domain-containing protein [Streptomyces cyaneofuscatus]|uniref:FG-GAP repeat domain-containing protein n=1 Tax=Streptomyces cyaneofuscatus TaxID=66883 RepID=UPI00368D522C
MSHIPGRARRRRTSALLAGLLTAACLSGTTPALAAPGQPIEVPDEATALMAAEAKASARATAEGEPVEVASARTETGEVHAMPDGTMRRTEHTAPVRVKRAGQWQAINTDLHRSGARLAPKAAPGEVTFSAGGDGELATFTDKGRSVTLKWPDPLPQPQLDGPTATYPEVLPGVDLAVSAKLDGFGHVLIVKDAQAAAQPRLKTITYGLEADGLRVEKDEASDTLRAVTPQGQEVFSTSTPRMWDSSSTGTARRTALAQESDPGVQSADLPLTLSPDALTLTPDQDLLNGEATTYPVYLDPNFNGAKQAWTIAYSRYPSTSYWNGANWNGSYKDQPRVGYEQDSGGKSRAFFRLNSKGLGGVQVLSAQFQITNTYSWSCSGRSTELWLTGGISNETTWSKQPSWSTKLQTKSFAYGYNSSCNARPVDFDAKVAAERAAAGNWANITVGLRSTSETDTYTWKRFNNNPKIIISYNRKPNTPSSMQTSPSTSTSTACNVAPYVTLGNTDVTLRAKISDPDGGTVKARFHLWPTGKHPNDAAGGVLVINRDVQVTSGSMASTVVSKNDLKRYEGFGSGGRFSWKVSALDAHTSSGYTPAGGGCAFGFDSSRPSSPPGVTSTEFPNGDGGTWGAPARTEGSFTLASGGVSDVVKYTYGLNSNPPTTEATPSSAGGSVTVRLTPTHTGPHILYVVSHDGAGNKSDTQAYLFYASSPGTPEKPGDLNGDGHPDLYAVDSTSNLRFYPGNGEGRFGARMDVSTTGQWAGSLITHRGDWTADGYEDLIARRSDGKLWLYPTDGLGRVDEETRQEVGQFATPGEPEYIDPASVDQLVSLGDMSADPDAAKVDFAAVIGDTLWYLPGYTGGHLDYGYPIADTGWKNMTLVSPGDLDGDGHPDLIARDTVSGQVWLHRGKPGPDGGTDPFSLADPATRTAYATGLPATTHPLMTATGDASGDGITDLWSTHLVTGSGNLMFHPGRATGAAQPPLLVGSGGWHTIRSIA